MRRKFRAILSLFFALVCTVCLAAALTACNPHEHTWSESWTTDSDYHWHAPKCDDTDEVKDKAAHVDANQDGKCDVCKYDVGHEHTFADGWTSDETHHWHEATCSHTNEKGSYAEHEDLDEDGECDTCHKAVEHKHRYAKEWSTDKDNHWHDATCSHQNEQSEFGPHIDEDQNGYCDVCDYEIGHEHSYEEGWTTSETQHWHAATCTHQNMKSELGDHDFDENGDCRTCHYHKHVFSEEWTVDMNKHWHVATCADGGDEKSNEEAHDFGFSGKCKCGVEKIEINIYNMYYTPAQEFADEEVKDFGAWHAELVKAGVKHIELDVLTQDVVYTYDNPDGEDITEVKYGSAKTVNVKIAKGELLEVDEQGLPDVTFKVIAKIDGEPVANGKALGTGKINRISGEGEIIFMPYFGYSSAKNHAGQKIEYAITLAAEGDKDYVEVPNAYLFMGETEVTFTVSGDAHAETFTGSFDMERALGTGELGKITGIDFGDPSASSAYGGVSSYYLNVPEGWYMLSYDDGGKGGSAYHVSAAIDDYLGTTEGHTKPNPKYAVALSYGKGVAAYDGVIYIPADAKKIYLENWNNSTRNGTLTMEPYEFPELKTDGSENYVVAAHVNSSYKIVDYKLPADAYKFTVSVAGAYPGDTVNVLVNDVSIFNSSSGEVNVIIKESDKINFKVRTSSGTWCKAVKFKIDKLENAELNKDFTFSFSSAHKTETKALKAAKDGLYAITLTSESDLKSVSVGYGASSTNNLVGTASAERKEIKTYIYLKAGDTQILNIGFTGSSNYAENITCKITEAQPEAITAGTETPITVDSANPIQYRSFTATKDGFYTFCVSSSNNANIQYFTAGVDGSTNDLINSYTTTRYAASGVFYAKKSVPVVIAFTRSSTATFTLNCLINEVGEFTPAELNTATTLGFSIDDNKIISAHTFTATEAGEYMLTLNCATSIATSVNGINIVRLGKDGLETLASTGGSTYKKVVLTLDKGEKVDLLFTYSAVSTSSYPEFCFTVNYSAPTALTVDKEETLKFSKDLYTKTYTFNATEAGNYMLVLSTSESNLNNVDVLNGEGESLFSGGSQNLTFKNVLIALEKDAKLTLVFNYNYGLTTTSEREIKLMLGRIVSEDLTANGTKDVTLGNGKVFKSFNFTATDEAYYSLVLSTSSETGLKDIKIIDGDTGVDVVKKITSSSTKFSFNAYKLTAEQKINFLIVYEGSTEVSLKFRVEYDTPTAMTANNNVEITFSEENNAEYYSFTAKEEGYYVIALTSENALNHVQLYNAATNGSVGSASSTSKYYITTRKLAAEEKFNFLVKFNSNENYPTVNFRVEYDTYAAMTPGEDVTFEFSKDNLAVHYSFTAPKDGKYVYDFATETDLMNLHVINGDTGLGMVFKITTSTQFKLNYTTLKAGETIKFLVYYEITEAPETFPTINFKVEYDEKPKEMKVNEDTEVTFKQGQNAVFLSFTATDASYYTLVVNAETDIKNVTISDAQKSTTYGTVSNAKFLLISNKLKLAEKEQVIFLIYFDGYENYPTFKFRVEYDTPKALTVNTAQEITFSEKNNAEYYSFTAKEDATYSLVLTSETSLKNVTVANLQTSGDLLAVTTDDKAKILISSATKLSASKTLNLAVLYKGNEDYPVVSLTIVYNKPTEMTVNEDTTITFSKAKRVEYLSFTATAEGGWHAFQLTSDTSLKDINVYSVTKGSSFLDNITTDVKYMSVFNGTLNLKIKDNLVLAVVYNGSESYPTVNARMVFEEPTQLEDKGTITFKAGTHIKTISLLSEEACKKSLVFESTGDLNSLTIKARSNGAQYSLSNGKITVSLTANTSLILMAFYSGSEELKLNYKLVDVLATPTNFKAIGYNLLTWDAVEGATKYKVSWLGNDKFSPGSKGSAETDKTYYAIPEIKNDWTSYSYTVMAIDETGNHGDSSEAKTTKGSIMYDLNKKLHVTVEVPEGFPEEARLLIIQTGTALNFNSLIAGNCIEVKGQGKYECDLPLAASSGNQKVYLRIDPKTLPAGYTCEVSDQITGGTDVSKTLKITKTA